MEQLYYTIDKITVFQKVDCCSDTKFPFTQLDVTFHDGGGGYFARLSTEEFAISSDDKSVFNLIDSICKTNTNVFERLNKES